VFIAEDTAGHDAFHLDEAINFVVCADQGVTDQVIKAMRMVTRDKSVVEAFLKFA
jgi:hypothetical protein